MKKKIRRSLSILCVMALVLSAFGSAAATSTNQAEKAALYETYLEIIEEKSAQYDIGFIPVTLNEFNLTASQLERFENLWDSIGALQMETTQMQVNFTDVMPYVYEDLERASGQSMSKFIIKTVGAVQLTIRISGTFYTEYDASRGVQVFSSSTPKPTAHVDMPKGYSWTETANNSGVLASNRQRYVAAMQGNITGVGTGTFTGINLSTTFYCSDTGGIS